jgi:hypothetical protein
LKIKLPDLALVKQISIMLLKCKLITVEIFLSSALLLNGVSEKLSKKKYTKRLKISFIITHPCSPEERLRTNQFHSNC